MDAAPLRGQNGAMAMHVAFLRAVNLGSTRVFPKADIQRVVTGVGFDDVATHINSGNVRFDTRMRSCDRISQVLERAFALDRGFDVPAVVFSTKEFRVVADEAARLAAQHPGAARHYVYLLKAPLSPDRAAQVEATSDDAGAMVVRGRSVHALLRPGYQPGAVDPLGAAKLMPEATARTATVVATIAEKWC